MDQPWYRRYFWLLIFGGIIIVTAIISFVMFYFCRTQLSRRLTRQFRRISKKETPHQNVAVITDNSFYQLTAPPTIILPETADCWYDTKAEGVITNQMIYAAVKKEPVTLQQQGINTEYNRHKYNVDLHVPNNNDRFSYASYDSVGHITDSDYVNIENCTKFPSYIEVLADDDEDSYDDVEII